MYKEIRATPSLLEIYKKQLIDKEYVTEQQITELTEKFNKILQDSFDKSKTFSVKLEDVRNETYKGQKSLTKKWKDIIFPAFCEKDTNLNTNFDKEKLKSYLKTSITLPQDFQLHPRLNEFFVKTRQKNLELNMVDWNGAEIAAIGSLLEEGNNVRISGQDTIRGTFSHRHIGFFEQNTNTLYYPLKNANLKGRLEVNNSALSEFGVLLFDYGYSLENPRNLVIWEAQFGDFYNGAQIAIDQFIATGESKWMRQSGLVMLLPHGYDHTGPEHTSSHIERFLQLVNANGIDVNNKDVLDHRHINMSVANLTTPANYFHILRRQMVRKYRKPLIIAAPKIGLKHAAYTSSIDELSKGKFKPIIVDEYCNDKNKLKGVIFCSGQIFMEIKKQIETYEKETNSKCNLNLIRIEEIAPFPEDEITNYLQMMNNSKLKFYWVQEENSNFGSFTFVTPHLRRIMKKLQLESSEVIYVGRSADVAANGCSSDSVKELNKLSSEIKSLCK